jgi:hypothetical protein
MSKQKISSDGRTITVQVPISLRKRGGRKLLLAPDGTAADFRTMSRRHIDDAMVKGLARAFRWREMLEAGKHSTIKEVAETECINQSYVSRILRLTLLDPEIVQVIVEGRQPANVTLSIVLKPFGPIWKDQRVALQFIP